MPKFRNYLLHPPSQPKRLPLKMAAARSTSQYAYLSTKLHTITSHKIKILLQNLFYAGIRPEIGFYRNSSFKFWEIPRRTHYLFRFRFLPFSTILRCFSLSFLPFLLTFFIPIYPKYPSSILQCPALRNSLHHLMNKCYDQKCHLVGKTVSLGVKYGSMIPLSLPKSGVGELHEAFLLPVGLSVMAIRFGVLQNEIYWHTHRVVPCEQSKSHKESKYACEVTYCMQVAIRQLQIRTAGSTAV